MNFEQKESHLKGKGTFATKVIKKGDKILSFTGKLINKKEMYHLVKEQIESYDDPLQIGENEYLLLDNQSYYINHCCNPNTAISGTVDLIAIKTIHPGDEITYDYSATEGHDSSWVMDCLCGAENCRKKIRDINSVPIKQIEKYYKAGGLQTHIRNYLNFKDANRSK